VSEVAAFDKMIHERARLLILTYLAANGTEAVDFTRLQEKLEFTSGNLSVQLKKLQSAGYVDIRKTFRDNKPNTAVTITAAGSTALQQYLAEMEAIIHQLKG
jgi:DNA-binding MarR family transcriptional regulator